jgi:uncharacterized protein (TIGR02147 family)
MKASEVFEFEDYKAFLRAWLDRAPRGSLSRLAKAAGCQVSFFSQVLSRKVHLSHEQAWLVGHEMGLEDLEHRYFLKLIALGRAQKPRYVDSLLAELKDLKSERHNLKERFPVADFLSEDEKSRYFSSYLYSAVHLLCEIPTTSNARAMANYLNVSETRVKGVLRELEEMGLVKRAGTGFSIGKRRLHISSDSNLIVRHHTNWRLQALSSIEGRSKESLHYSSLVTLSEADVFKIKNLLVDVIGQFGEIVSDTKNEHCYVFNTDFFELSQNK